MPETTSSASPSFDAIVVGSGPGGASVARELAVRDLRVLILEQGSAAPLKGTLAQMARIGAVPGKGAFLHRDASLLVQGINAGGSSSINFATAADPPLARFAAYGIDLAPALQALRAELPIGPLPDSLVGPMAARIMQGALALGMDWRKLDKMIRPQLCRAGCWRCVYGCPFGAKWSARDFIEQARTHGATLLDRARATRVLVQNGQAAGVEYVREGKLEQAAAPLVILAGGGVGSPRLLHSSGLRAQSSSLFSDPVVAVMGTVDGMDGGAEVPMAAGMRLDDAGISLADMTLPRPMYQAFTAQAGRFDRLFAHRRTLSIMVKIADQAGGAVGPRWVDKTLHQADRDKLAQGVAMARAILASCGATHVFTSHHFAAHPGGSVRIGDGVDNTLQAAAAGLHVCDASVIPGPWGLPPTLTLLCLGKWLGQRLAR
ncbi:MAG TPA: GMC family oxidoreductase N-terminal domain-containing protein [Telluria sp.]|jgi:choline dehydrogenase-like flavoprotein